MIDIFCAVAILLFALKFFIAIARPFYDKYGKFKRFYHDILAYCSPDKNGKCKYCGKQL